MLNETFYLDGMDARAFGIQLQGPVEFAEAIPRREKQKIPGRNGDLIFETGSYENRDAGANCFCLQKDVEKALSSAGRFLMEKRGYRRLETSDDPEHFWMARVENSPKIAQRLRTLAPFTIMFDCKPQRFLKSGEIPVVFNESGNIFNSYGQTALPLIAVYGDGVGRIEIGDTIVLVDASDGVLFLDSDTQNAYNEAGDQNGRIQAAEFPVLKSGLNLVGFSGFIDRIEITPRWWEL